MSQILLQTAETVRQLGETVLAVSPLPCKMAAVSVRRNYFLLPCAVKYGVIRSVYGDQLALHGVYRFPHFAAKSISYSSMWSQSQSFTRPVKFRI